MKALLAASESLPGEIVDPAPLGRLSPPGSAAR